MIPEKKSRFEIQVAGPSQDTELRDLMKRVPMGRNMVVTFEREPSFFAPCCLHGEAQVCAGHDTRTGRLVGMGTRAIAPAFLNGASAPLGYLGDLRLLAEYRGGTLVLRAYRFLHELHRDGRTPLYTTVVFADNEVALRTIARGRAGLPRYHDMGTMHYPGINLTRRKPAVNADCRIVRGDERMLPAIVDCLNRNGARRQFAPVHSPRDFQPGGRWLGLKAESFVAAVRNYDVVGALAIWDQRAFKQTRIVRYGGMYRWGAPLSRFMHRLVRAPRLPSPGEVVPYCYFSFLAADRNDPTICRALLRSAYNEALHAGYMYAMVSAHERDPLLSMIREYRCTPFAGRLFCVAFPENEPDFRLLDGRVPSAEAAVL